MKSPAPKTIRGLMNAFEAYRSDAELASLTENVEWDGVPPSQVYYSVLNRIPETGEAATPRPDYSAQRLFEAALDSLEFQEGVVPLVLNAYPEKRRLIFIHILKCAGTDLIAHLSAKYPHVYRALSEPEWTSKAHLFAHLGDLTRAAAHSSEIFMSGHVDLTSVLESGLYRFGDEIFTIVREPIERVLSMVNYVVSILGDMSDPLRPDRLTWLNMLGAQDFPHEPSPGFLREIARAVLKNRQILVPNVLCRSLGYGDAVSALDAIVRSDIEITDAKRYEAWLAARWGVQNSERLNASPPVLKVEDLTDEELDYLRLTYKEDVAIYELIDRKLAEAGAPSIRGLALAGAKLSYPGEFGCDPALPDPEPKVLEIAVRRPDEGETAANDAALRTTHHARQ